MNGEELIEYLERKGDAEFDQTEDTRGDGDINFNPHLASLVPTKDAYLLDNMIVYDVMIRQDRIHDYHSIDEIREDWRNAIRLVEESQNSGDKKVHTIEGFKDHFIASGRKHSGYQAEEDTINVVSDYFQSNTDQVNLFDYSPREPVMGGFGPIDKNDKRIASACNYLDATWITFDDDALAYRTDIEVTTPQRALEEWA